MELLVTFSLTMLLFASFFVWSGQIIVHGEKNEDQLILQREASAMHFLLMNEMKQGYDFRVIEGELYFQLAPAQTIRLRSLNNQLTRAIKDGAYGSFKGNIVLARNVEQVIFSPDARGVGMHVIFKKGDATLTYDTYWHSRIERQEM
mgnify:CR=1 FL=1